MMETQTQDPSDGKHQDRQRVLRKIQSRLRRLALGLGQRDKPKQHGIGDLREMSESLQNFRFQLRSPTGGDVTVWQQGYGLDNAKWRVLQQYKGWVIQRVWPG